MSLSPEAIDALVAAGASAEMLAAAFKAELAADQARKAAQREGARLRKQRQRERESGNVTRDARDIAGQSVTERDTPLSRPPNEINSNPPTQTPGDITTRPRKAGPRPADFEAWWAVYPRKVEKVAARKAFERAWALVDPPDKLATLIAAATAYAERTDPAFIKHPTTWLNKGCWSDETQETARILTYERPRPAQPSPGRDDRLDRMLSGLVAAVNGPGS